MTPERRAEIEKRAEGNYLKGWTWSAASQAHKDRCDLLAALSSSESKIAKAVEALGPFAHAAQFYDSRKDDRPIAYTSEFHNNTLKLTVGDMRRARTTIAMLKGETT